MVSNVGVLCANAEVCNVGASFASVEDIPKADHRRVAAETHVYHCGARGSFAALWLDRP